MPAINIVNGEKLEIMEVISLNPGLVLRIKKTIFENRLEKTLIYRVKVPAEVELESETDFKEPSMWKYL